MGIIVVTGRGALADRVAGLEMGADDYVAKPFEPRELLARARSVLRRVAGSPHGPDAVAEILHFGEWTLHLSARRLIRLDNSEIPLTSAEFDLLSAFARNPNRVLSRDRLFNLIRKRESTPFNRSIDVLVARLRRKLEADPGQPALIKTIHGSGYLFFAERETSADNATAAGHGA